MRRVGLQTMRPCQTSRFRHFVISARFVWSSHVMCFELWLPSSAARLASISGIGSAYSGTVLKYGTWGIVAKQTLLTGGFWFQGISQQLPLFVGDGACSALAGCDVFDA